MRYRTWIAPATAIALIATGSPAQAHRLDEYLQATTINLARDRITLHLRLTPGVDVADRVIRDIDRDGNGRLSPQERQAYAMRMAQGLSVSLNNRPVTLQPGASSFPDTDAMRAGTGMIVLQFGISTRLANGPYRLTYLNNAPGPETVRLTNCLLPQDTSIHVLAQKRSEDQSFYQLDFLVGPGDSAPHGTDRTEAASSVTTPLTDRPRQVSRK
ncbi:hypothetical protein [Gluconacetobacter asukensis]|uniref:hypothetical protein n=1 Tax=Gluconacetobacter asukensis TaxID=1017181 RepID=UPI001FEC4043|nr:hypothetical protein [Gluconacetobacter asukensis]